METFVGGTVKILVSTGIDLSGFGDIKVMYKKTRWLCRRVGSRCLS